MEANRVCSGRTGEVLDGVIRALVEKLEECPIDNFPAMKLGKGDNGGIRYACNIVNASNVVHFMALTGDSEPKTEEEIRSTFEARNINEVIGKKGINYFILFGGKSKILFDMIEGKKNFTYAQTIHLSARSLNSKLPNSLFPECTTPEERQMKRCEVIANRIFEQLLKNTTRD